MEPVLLGAAAIVTGGAAWSVVRGARRLLERLVSDIVVRTLRDAGRIPGPGAGPGAGAGVNGVAGPSAAPFGGAGVNRHGGLGRG
ncbi:hypothetical protein [Streptomyces sp. CAU 1734]|uniref:hypothetical protein n=1 Tax=Streptomyces sp. CAU 1734 TaxID=3140360 RepID=UPI0032610379